MNRFALVCSELMLAAALGVASYSALAGGLPQPDVSVEPSADTGATATTPDTGAALPAAPGASATGSTSSPTGGASAEFSAFDMNSDGSLSMDEVKSDAKLKDNFQSLDKDQSGSLSQDEYSASGEASGSATTPTAP